MSRWVVPVFLVASFAAWTATGDGQTTAPAPAVPDVRIVAESIEEVRFANLDSKINPPRVKPELKVAIRIAGAAAARARRCSFPDITRAVDDTGRDLTPRDASAGGSRPDYFNATPKNDEILGPNGYPLVFRLPAASRGARTIAQITGTVTLVVGGEVVEVVGDPLDTGVETEVAHPSLAAAAVKITVRPLARTGGGGTVKVVATGSWELLLDAQIVDSSGKSTAAVGQAQQADGSYAWTLPVKSPEGSRLRLRLISGARIVEAPINLKDVRLP